MNPRLIAEDAASWYLSVLDPTSSHADNVQRYLRGAVLVITRRILLDEGGGFDGVGGPDGRVPAVAIAATQDPQQNGGVAAAVGAVGSSTTNDGSPDWRAYLDRVSSVDSTDGDGPTAVAAGGDDNGGERLSRRSVVRMRAFLRSCALAVPDDPFVPGGSSGAPSPTKKDAGTNKAGEGKAPAAAAAVSAAAAAAASPPLRSQLHPSSASAKLAESSPGGLSLEAALSGFSVGESGAGSATAKEDGAAEAAPSAGAEKLPPPPKTPKQRIRSVSSSSSAATTATTASSLSGRSRSGSLSSSRRRPPPQYPQFSSSDLTVRIELYVRSLRRVRESGNECVVNLEPARAVKARVRAVIESFVDTVGCVRSISPVLTNLVGALTRELLAVEVLGEELRRAVGRLVSEYEHLTSFASLAFLSTPEESAGSHLSPLLTSYIQYLQNDWENLVAQCELESMLERAIDPDVRAMFKTIEFQSIGHLLDVCHDHRGHLQNISLPRAEEEDIMTRCADPKLLRQAMKDVRRETITVNGHVLPPARNLKDLVRLLTQALNSGTLTLSHAEKKKKKKQKQKQRGGKKASSAFKSSQSAQAGDTGNTSSEDSGAADNAKGMIISDGDLSSGCEGDTDASLGDRGGETTRRAKRRSFDLSTVEYMTRRLLIAASRTGTGGDAYFVVRDLFGGDEVEVLPSNSQPTYSSSRPNMMGRVPRKGSGGTIELIVRLASVTIKCHGRYDVYPKPLVGDCEPLIQLHTTTTETVSMHEVRVNDVGNRKVVPASTTDDGDMSATVLMLKEKKTDTTGHRTLQIRPALYEKVEVWATPS